jgi:hypothetical protein
MIRKLLLSEKIFVMHVRSSVLAGVCPQVPARTLGDLSCPVERVDASALIHDAHDASYPAAKINLQFTL